ncbi:MAG: DUF2058 domain-containing protein [Cellvibrio sp.]|jgi:Uncharacterized protein conserved in bacteria
MPSLQDQLLKAGLVDKKQVKQANKEKRKQTNLARRSTEAVVDEVKQQAEQARQEKAARDRELNRQRDQEMQNRAIAAQIKQLVDNNRQPKGGDVEYNFTDGKHIKKIRVTPTIQQQLIRGQLTIVKSVDEYELVPRVIADKIAVRDPACVLVANTRSASDTNEDDPYADYVIPDDLMW